MPVLETLAAAAAKAAKAKAAQEGSKAAKKLAPTLMSVGAVLLLIVCVSLNTFFGSSNHSGVLASSSAIQGAALALQNAQSSSATVDQSDYSCSVNTGVVSSNSHEMPKGPPTPYDALFARAAAETPGSFDSTTLKAQAWAESGWNPNASSGVAFGIIQFTRGTWAIHGVDGDGDGKKDILNPADNIMASAKYTAKLGQLVAGIPGDPMDLKLAGYNAGPGNVLKYRGVPPFPETQNYIRRIRGKVTEWGSSLASSNAACTQQTIGVSGDWSKPIAKCVFSSPYGPRGAVAGVHGARFHAGQDCAAPIGTPLFAVHGGKVLHKNDPGGYGTYVILDVGNGVTVVYGHMSRYATEDGATLPPGGLVGYSGNTGGSSGPHLHYETRVNNKAVNPIEFMRTQGVSL